MLEKLENDILSGKYQPNEKLPGIPQLAKEFGVSYGKAHNVIKKLAEKRLVIVEHGVGTYALGKQPLAVDWLWFTGADRLYDELIDRSFSFIKDFYKSKDAEKIILSFKLFDVRWLPSPKTFAKANHDCGIRGLIICGHGKHFLKYINKLSSYIPVVSLFGQWKGNSFKYVAPDMELFAEKYFKNMKSKGQNKIGLISAPVENHPNYSTLFNITKKYSEANNITFSKEDFFASKDYNDITNWMIGRFSTQNHPKYWLTSSIGHAKAVKNAAEAKSMKVPEDIHIFTFSMLESEYKKTEKNIGIALQQFDLTVKAGIKLLEEMVWDNEKNTINNSVKIPMKIIEPSNK
jgi:DNA-binding transcriptional regulator YhcF (GntR family)